MPDKNRADLEKLIVDGGDQTRDRQQDEALGTQAGTIEWDVPRIFGGRYFKWPFRYVRRFTRLIDDIA